jgi:hypothetical protein
MRRIRANARPLVVGGGDWSVLQQQRWLWPLLRSHCFSKGEGERKCAVWTTLGAAVKLECVTKWTVAVNLESDKTHKNTLVAVNLESDKAHHQKLYLAKIRIWLTVVLFWGQMLSLFWPKTFGKFWDKIVFFIVNLTLKNWKFLDITKVKKNQLTKSAFLFLFWWHLKKKLTRELG